MAHDTVLEAAFPDHNLEDMVTGYVVEMGMVTPTSLAMRLGSGLNATNMIPTLEGLVVKKILRHGRERKQDAAVPPVHQAYVLRI